MSVALQQALEHQVLYCVSSHLQRPQVWKVHVASRRPEVLKSWHSAAPGGC